jgi:hypothetical protein
VGLGHPEWEALAKAYYALQSTGDVDRLDSQIFEDIHRNHVWLYDEQSIMTWVGKHRVDAAKFTAAFRSFNVNMSAATRSGGRRIIEFRESRHWRLPGSTQWMGIKTKCCRRRISSSRWRGPRVRSLAGRSLRKRRRPPHRAFAMGSGQSWSARAIAFC